MTAGELWPQTQSIQDDYMLCHSLSPSVSHMLDRAWSCISHLLNGGCTVVLLMHWKEETIRFETDWDESVGKWFIARIQLWRRNEKQLTSNIIVCIIWDFSFFFFCSNPRSYIAAWCVCKHPVWWSELKMKMFHLFNNPCEEGKLNVNPSLLEMVTMRGGKGEGGAG